MRLAALTWLLLRITVASLGEKCSEYELLKHLHLDEPSPQFTHVRPVINSSTALEVRLDVVIHAILDVREVDQMMVSYVWTSLQWENEHLKWDPDEFCGTQMMPIPSGSLWKPDIIIEEMTEKDESPPPPHIMITAWGTVVYRNDGVVVSTCQMDVYKFPFDTQECDLTFRSLLLPDSQIRLRLVLETHDVAVQSWLTMTSESEWVFVDITVTNSSRYYPYHEYSQDIVTYSVQVRRRSVLYVANFILPVLFLLFLDLASFLMSDTGGEKLGFKITVLLAVTVMQLLLNDILPTSSNRVPLIAVFCIGVFFLMLLSLLESIVVLYLINKDQEPDQDRPKDVAAPCREAIPCLKKAEQSELSVQNQDKKERPGTWTQKARKITRIFFIFYIIAVVLFLGILFILWTH